MAFFGLLSLGFFIVFLDDVGDLLSFRRSQPKSSNICIPGLGGKKTRELVTRALQQLGVESENFGLHALKDEVNSQALEGLSETEIFTGEKLSPLALPGLEAVINFSKDRGQTKLLLMQQRTYRKLNFNQLLPELHDELASGVKSMDPDPQNTKRAALYYGFWGGFALLVGCGLIAGLCYWTW